MQLVTGAAGVIGFAYTQRVLEQGGVVIAVDDGRKGGMEDLEALARLHPGRLKVHLHDLCSGPPPVRGPFDAIAHFAAVLGVQYVAQHPWQTLRENSQVTLDLLAFGGAERTRVFLFASSSECYAAGVAAGELPLPTPEDVPLSIADPILPRWSYAASKLLGEAAVFSAAREYGFAPAVARFHNVYGPRMGPTHVVPDLLRRCHAREDPLLVLGPEQTRTFLYVEDAARALELVVAAAARTGGGIWNVGGEREIAMGDLARLCLSVSGHRASIRSGPAPDGSVQRRAPDLTRLVGLGFAPTVSLEAGLRACWDHLVRKYADS